MASRAWKDSKAKKLAKQVVSGLDAHDVMRIEDRQCDDYPWGWLIEVYDLDELPKGFKAWFDHFFKARVEALGLNG